MRELIDDLGLVYERTEKRHKRKYEKLRSAIAALAGRDEERILVAYLAPTVLRAEAEKSVDHFFSLESFAEQDFGRISPEHLGLWPYVRDLLRSIRTP